MLKRLLVTTLIGTLVYFLFGWFVFDFILGNYTNLHTTQLVGFKKTDAEFSLSLLLVSCAAYAALISFILVYLLNNKSPSKAFFISATIGILVAIMTDSYWYATSHFYTNVSVVLLDIAAAAVTVGFMGFVIAATNKKLQ